MSIPDIKAMLSTDDATTRTDIITIHLEQMEAQLQQTRDTVGALRELLSPVHTPAFVAVRHQPALAVWSIGATLEVSELDSWFSATLSELQNAVATAAGVTSGVVPGGLYDRDLFLESRGEATLFVPAPESADLRRASAPRSCPGLNSRCSPTLAVTTGSTAVTGPWALTQTSI